MNRSVCLSCVTLIAFAGCRPNQAAKGLDSLRHILIERQTILTLGGKMPQSSDFCIWSGATCTLKPGRFSGTKTMSFSKTDSGLISQFQFDYGALSDEAVNAQIDDYTNRLGRPSSDSTVKNGEFDVRELVWSDSSTTFDLTYKTDRKQTEASATLSDNTLSKPTL